MKEILAISVLTIAIIILTATNNPVLLFVIFSSLTLIASVFYAIHKKSSRYFFFSLIWVLLFSLLSVLYKDYRYAKPITHTPILSTQLATTGTITDTYREWRYIFADPNNREYILYTEKEYNIGDQIFLAWYHYTTAGIVQPLFSQSVSWPSLFSGGEYQFDYNRWLVMRWLYGTIYENNSVLIWQADTNRRQWIRKTLLEKVDETFTNQQNKALIAGMLIGDRSYFSDQQYTDFIDSGLVHLVAVSGGNVVMLVIFLSLILFRVPFYLRNILILCAIVVYGMICGWDSSVIRAVIMWSLSLLALFAWRPSYTRRSLVIAYIAIIAFNPYVLVYDIGFIFSFSAVVWIVISMNSIKPYISHLSRRSQLLIASYIVPTIWASIAVLPFLLFFTGSFSLFSIAANILIAPLVPIVMIGWWIATIIEQWSLFHPLIGLYEYVPRGINSISQRVVEHNIRLVNTNPLFMAVVIAFYLAIFIKHRIDTIRR